MFRNRFILPAALLALSIAAGPSQAQQYQQGPPPQQNGYGQNGYGNQGGWEQAPPEFTEARRRGFRDGVEGARKDFENHRPPNVNNRDEFRNPSFIPRPDRREYRFGFKRGYDVGVQHIYHPGGPGPRSY